ncbi:MULTISPECIES: xanthine dehydrogenase family protein molybdopterin-binding subunit [Paraburkholderia]|uniref:Molybdopterin-dependent oxidoreductase n=1 Tax=Paraburkholderia metrosideri TaxID=580937 RepID=A0ABW9E4G7_9BURK
MSSTKQRPAGGTEHPRNKQRRRFLLGALGVTGALVIGWGVVPPRSRTGVPDMFPASPGQIALNGWIKIGTDGTVTVAVPPVEMGQGIDTAFAMLVAEELGVPLDRVRTQTVTRERIYGNVAALVDSMPIHPDDDGKPWARALRWMLAKSARELGLIITASSSSVADAWQPLREAAASARTILVEAAARNWNVDPGAVSIRDGMIVGPDERRLPIEHLAGDASRLRPPSSVTLKPASSYTLLGTPAPRVDVAPKTDGSAVFALDVRPPGLRYAAVSLCPKFGGTLARFRESAVRAMPGVVAVVRLDGLSGGPCGIAVIGEHYWQARQALDSASPTWNEGPHATLDSDRIDAVLSAELAGPRDGITYRTQGDGLHAFDDSRGGSVIEAEYRVPYLAHAAMEPTNCTAQVSGGRVRLWAPTQAATLARLVAARVAGVSGDQVDIEVPFIGGGFGRRAESDFVAQAVSVALHANGRPVQVIWSREDDLRHDFYRPQVHARLRARIDGTTPIAIASRSVGQSILAQELGRTFGAPGIGLDRYTTEGMFDMPYEFAHQHVAHLNVDLPVPIGFWRSVGHSYNAFFLECFVDEIAAAAGRDPLELRRALLRAHPRHVRVLDAAAQAAGIEGSMPAASGDGRQAYGIAMHASFGSVAAQVAEVSLQDGQVRVHRIVCAIDCGFVVNPQIVGQQVESGVIFGLSAALYGDIRIAGGQVVQSNFTDYPVVTMASAPLIETHLIASAEPPSGVGEVAVPPVAPAVANALYRLTGKRIRRLPILL